MIYPLTGAATPGEPIKPITILHASGQYAGIEPSGITLYTDASGVDWFYIVSDNGVIARRKADLSDSWLVFDSGAGWRTDFEAITVVAGQLMIGVEAPVRIDDTRYAVIRQFDPADTSESPLGSFTGSEWILKNVDVRGKGGLEALAFVPGGAYPDNLGSGKGHGGLFFASFQATPGTIFIYDLPQGNGQVQAVEHASAQLTTPLLKEKLSDLSYSAYSGVLYILYDDKGSWLQELVLDKKGRFVEQRRSRLPYFGYEAVVEYCSNLCLGLDPTAADRKKNGFDQSFITCVPWSGLDPQTWAEQP